MISVSWMTKTTRRIEYVTVDNATDDYDKQVKETEEKDYEASFPNSE